MKVNIKTDIEIPSVPNFIKEKGASRTFPIQNFTEVELRAIAAEWTELLIKKAISRL